jgi:predicted Zn finger-like uncharacterized protein
VKFSCPKCTTKYSISDSKVPAGKTLRFTCKKCANVFKIRRKAKDPAPTKVEVPEFSSGNDDEGATRVANINEIMALKKRSKSAPPPAPAAPAAPTSSPFDEQVEWFVLVGGKQQGPFGTERVRRLLKEQKVDKRTYAWREGMGDWLRLGVVPEFENLANEAGDATWRGDAKAAKKPAAAAAAAPSGEPTKETVAMDAGHLREQLAKLGSAEAGVRGEQRLKTTAPLNDSEGALAALVGEPTGDTLSRDDGATLNEFEPFDPTLETTPPPPGLPPVLADAAAHTDPKLRGPMANRDAEYLEAAPGEATRVFMATAGLFKRRRMHRTAAIVGGVVATLLVGVISLDLAGFIEIPAMGLVYDLTGLEDPNVDRAMERVESKLQDAELSPEERAAIEKRQAALRA